MQFTAALLAAAMATSAAAAETHIGDFTAKDDAGALRACVESLIANRKADHIHIHHSSLTKFNSSLGRRGLDLRQPQLPAWRQWTLGIAR